MPKTNLALELLTGCGMIRKSEKRSLIGLEASVATDISPETGSPAAAQALPQPFGFLFAYGVPLNLRGNEKSMLPLVNPF
jgi:hypothetical protein